jgi:hypothetical protein
MQLASHHNHLLNEHATEYAAQTEEEQEVLIEDSENIPVLQLVVALGRLLHYCCPLVALWSWYWRDSAAGRVPHRGKADVSASLQYTNS